MTECECSAECPFYNGLRTQDQAKAFLNDSFCREEYTYCARHIIYEKLGFHCIPRDMKPGEITRAFDILGEW